MLSVNKAGELQISSKWVETLVANSDNERKKKLFFFSHVGYFKNNIDSYMSSINKENSISKSSNELRSFYEASNPEKIHLSFWYDGLKLELIQNLKFMFLLSSCFIIQINSSESQLYDDDSMFIVKSLFFYTISEIKTNKMKKISVFFIINPDKKLLGLYENNLIELEKLWKKCLELSKINEQIVLKDFFDFNFFSFDQLNYEYLQNFVFSNDKIETRFENIVHNHVFLQQLLNKKWIDSLNIPKNLLVSVENEPLKENIIFYFADSAFHEVWESSQQILKRWNKIIYKGKTIENYGKIAASFLENINKKFECFIPNEFSTNQITLKKKLKFNNIIQQKISYLFTKQLLNLQSQGLDKFKDILLKIASDPNKNFDSEKKIAIESISKWFIFNADSLVSRNIKLSYVAAQKELDNVLIEFSEKFKESPIVKIQSLQRLEKQTSTSGLKQSGIVIGFGLTAALRPNGFGNLQLVTSYTQGPHVFNFSLVNDRDIAEQEGQGKIKPFRVQPSLNFDIEL